MEGRSKEAILELGIDIFRATGLRPVYRSVHKQMAVGGEALKSLASPNSDASGQGLKLLKGHVYIARV